MKVFASISKDEDHVIYESLTKEMMFAKFKFFGFYWSMGRHLKKNGHEYVYAPFKINYAATKDVKLPVSEAMQRGLFESDPPTRLKQLFDALEKLLEREVDAFCPDIVMITNNYSAACYILQKIARKRQIPIVSFHTSFVKYVYIVNTSNTDWEQHLSELCIGEHTTSLPRVTLRQGDRWHTTKSYTDFFVRNLERLFRFSVNAPSYDTWKLLVSSFVLKLYKPKWFPKHKTLNNNVNNGFLLVALHQPYLEDEELSWINLIRFAVECTPKNVPIVIRPHPDEHARNLPNGLERLLKRRSITISRHNTGPNLDNLFDRCCAVLTITSGLGMEALLRGKYVFTLGRAFYTRPGLAQHVTFSDASKVRLMLMQDKPLHPDIVEVQRFVNCLISEHMVNLFHPNGTKELARRLLSLADHGHS